ncbi:hypothetical protein REPUB_Repub03eG0284100 [Reevesia pubescens]
MSSKLIAGDSDFFANLKCLFSSSIEFVCIGNARGEVKYPIKGINILKAHGKSARDSYLLSGYALNTGRTAQGMPLRVSPAKIACLDFNLQTIKMHLGVQVLVTNPRELEKIHQREADMTKERIEKLLRAGANYFVEAGAIAVRRVRKEDMHHVAKATGATMVSTFADMEGKETFDSSLLGYAEEVVEERIADDYVVMIKGTKSTSSVSLILRGANDYMLDEMERALQDALSIVKRTLESNTVVAGGGAVEAALSVYLEYLATTLGSREQLAIAEFAESLLIIPKVLAVNAAKDATELVAKLRAYHHTAQTKADKKHFSSFKFMITKSHHFVCGKKGQDDKVVAFQDIKPAAFRHYLVISVEHIPTRSSKKKEETQRCTSVKSMQGLHQEIVLLYLLLGFHKSLASCICLFYKTVAPYDMQLFCTSSTYHGSMGNHHRGNYQISLPSHLQPFLVCQHWFRPGNPKALSFFIGKILEDDADWSSVGVKQRKKLMMMGTADEVFKAPERALFLLKIWNFQKKSKWVIGSGFKDLVYKLGTQAFIRRCCSEAWTTTCRQHLNMNSFAEFNYIYTIQQVKRRIISSVVPLQKLLEVVATYDFLLEVGMKIQHVQQTWKWLVDGFVSYYGVSDGYTKLRYGDAIGSFKLLSFVQFSFQLQIPFLCHGYGYTEDCLTLIYDLLSPVKGNSKHKLSHQKCSLFVTINPEPKAMHVCLGIYSDSDTRYKMLQGIKKRLEVIVGYWVWVEV